MGSGMQVAAYIKKEFDRKFGPTWHCVVGKVSQTRLHGVKGGCGGSETGGLRVASGEWPRPSHEMLMLNTRPFRPELRVVLHPR